MPRPRTATSWEVMPPLATTQAGSAATAARTTSMTAVDTRRAISRLAAGSTSRSRVRLVNRSTSESASAPTTRAVISATWASRRAGSATAGTSSSTSVRSPRSRATATCRLVRPTCEPTTTSPCPAGGPAGPDVRGLQRRLRVQPGQGLRERRTGPVQERLAGRLRLEQSEHDDVEVGVLDGVDHDERAVGHRGEDLGHPLRATAADVVEGDAVHLVRLDGAAALLGDELAQVRGGEAEGGVAGELGLADRQRLAPDPRPVHVTGGEAAGLQVRRDQQHAVVAAAEYLPAYRVQRGAPRR